MVKIANYLNAIKKDKRRIKNNIKILITNKLDERLEFTTSHFKKPKEKLTKKQNRQIRTFKQMVNDFSTLFVYSDYGFKDNKLEFFLQPVNPFVNVQALYRFTQLIRRENIG